jgi:hypothetical protein
VEDSRGGKLKREWTEGGMTAMRVCAVISPEAHSVRNSVVYNNEENK